MEVTQDVFQQQKYPQFGIKNPEPMDMDFWRLMVKNEEPAWWARNKFKADYKVAPDAIWCFHRFGMSRTELPDGRTICIAGEHEDFYDPDFYIYNDVIVLSPSGKITILGYPRKVFPPTDFHSATLVGNKIFIIGCLGYVPDRKVGVTPVYQLDCKSYRIERVETHGDNPGWLFDHKLKLNETGTKIIVWHGKILESKGDKQVFRKNWWEYSLDLKTFQWKINQKPQQ